MRSFAAPPVPLLVGVLAWSCTVYDSGLVPGTGGSGGEDGGAGTMGGGKSTAGSGSTNTAGGASATAGSAHSGEAGGGDGNVGGKEPMPNDGGQGNEAGEGSGGSGGSLGGTDHGGSAGTSGSVSTAGSAGSGGTGVVTAKCADHPVTAKATWSAAASSSSVGDGTEDSGLYNPPAHLIDGKYNERWSSGKAQIGDEWVEIDFGVAVTLSDITLNVSNDTGDYPRAYAVRVSNDEQDFVAPVIAMGDGMPGNTVIALKAPVTGRFLLVRQTGMNEPMVTSWWTIAEVLVSCQD